MPEHIYVNLPQNTSCTHEQALEKLVKEFVIDITQMRKQIDE